MKGPDVLLFSKCVFPYQQAHGRPIQEAKWPAKYRDLAGGIIPKGQAQWRPH